MTKAAGIVLCNFIFVNNKGLITDGWTDEVFERPYLLRKGLGYESCCTKGKPR
jgi:hypothetical protein